MLTTTAQTSILSASNNEQKKKPRVIGAFSFEGIIRQEKQTALLFWLLTSLLL
jgi:hypothetical protein